MTENAGAVRGEEFPGQPRISIVTRDTIDTRAGEQIQMNRLTPQDIIIQPSAGEEVMRIIEGNNDVMFRNEGVGGKRLLCCKLFKCNIK